MTQPVTFVSEFKELVLVRVPLGKRNERNAKMARVAYSFTSCPAGGIFTTEDPDIIEYIRNHEYVKKHRTVVEVPVAKAEMKHIEKVVEDDENVPVPDVVQGAATAKRHYRKK